VAWTFYRIVQTDPPTLVDFLSDVARGRVRYPLTSEQHQLRSGLSVFNTEAQARRKAQDWPNLGRHIAAVEIPASSAIRFERTLRSSPGHHTLWGDPVDLLACVVAVVPV
jgi:hypothetical protein